MYDDGAHPRCENVSGSRSGNRMCRVNLLRERTRLQVIKFRRDSDVHNCAPPRESLSSLGGELC